MERAALARTILTNGLRVRTILNDVARARDVGLLDDEVVVAYVDELFDLCDEFDTLELDWRGARLEVGV